VTQTKEPPANPGRFILRRPAQAPCGLANAYAVVGAAVSYSALEVLPNHIQNGASFVITGH
jgi:hypothetical protein